MDPDLVRQQQEAELEALALAAKKEAPKAPDAFRPEHMVSPYAPAFFAAQKSSGFRDDTIDATGRALSESAAQNRAEAQPDFAVRKEPPFARFGRFISYGVAGSMLGGGLGIAAYNYWRLPLEQANLVIFGPSGSLALFCAFASLFVKAPAYGEYGRQSVQP